MPRYPADESSYLTPILSERAEVVKPEPRGGEQVPSTRRVRPTPPAPRRSARTHSHRGRIPSGFRGYYSGCHLKPELDGPVCLQMVAGPRNHVSSETKRVVDRPL